MTDTSKIVTKSDLQSFYSRILPYLGSNAETGFTPVGTIISVMGLTAPANYLACDGTEYNIEDYQELATYFYEQFGSFNYFGGDGETTFAVPTKTAETDSIVCIAVKNLYIDPSLDYSTYEKVVGTWIDGKPLYQKTYDFGTLPNTATKNLSASELSSTYATIRKMVAYASNGSNILPIPYSDADYAVSLYYSDTYGFRIKTLNNRSAYTECYITVQYTKTTD